MKPDSRFGDYLLFRKLSSSPLGETYRAGRLQARAIDRVVLLHRFDGDAIDREELARGASARENLIELLEAPRFAHGLGQGVVDGIPYVAYDYLLGRSFKETLRRADDTAMQPGHAYLLALANQVATSLVTASKIRLDGVPIRHGFLVPELLLLSAEGRVYPLGFSHAPALARQERLRELYLPYLAPEASPADGHPGDDVYSLAAILFEGLTGRPPDPAKSTSTQVDQALFTTGGEPLPAPVQDLLKSGLSAAGSRPDLKAFQRALSRVIEQTPDAPSQFQLAFFLHRLFRDELEAEAVEMRDEKTSRFDPVALSPTATESTPASAEDLAPPSETPAPEPPAPRAPFGANPFLAGLAIALVLALAAVGISQWLRRGPGAEATAALAGGPAAKAAGNLDVGNGDVEGEVRRLVADGAADLQARLEEEYEPRLSKLRQDLATAQAQAAEKARRRAQAPPPVSEEQVADRGPAIEDPSGVPAVDGVNPGLAAFEVPTQEIEEAPEEREAAGTTSGTAGGPGEPIGSSDASGSGTPETENPAAETTAPAVEPGRQSPTGEEPFDGPENQEARTATTMPPDTGNGPTGAPAATAAPPAAAAPMEPDLPSPSSETVTAGAEVGIAGSPETAPGDAEGSYSPPKLLEPPRAQYPQAALRLKKVARVQLRVLVDVEGRASETEVLSEPAGFGFEKSALAAAARTRWTPAQRNGAATSAWATLTIDFRL